MSRYTDAPVMEPKVEGETDRKRWQRYVRNKNARLRWGHRMSELCARCGRVRLNVVHEDDRANALEGLGYYEDVPFCEFTPSGQYWR